MYKWFVNRGQLFVALFASIVISVGGDAGTLCGPTTTADESSSRYIIIFSINYINKYLNQFH